VGEGAFGCGVSAAPDALAGEGARPTHCSFADEGVCVTSDDEGSFAGEGSAGEGSLATEDSLAGEGLAGEGAAGCGSGSVATTQDSFAGEGLAGEGARPTFPTLAKSAGDQASSPMMRSGTRNRSTVTFL